MIFWANFKTAAAVVAVMAAVALSRRGDASEPPVQSKVEAGTPASVMTPRTWHVAPKELTGLPPAAQVRTISEAAAKAEPGDTVVIHDGIYRETVTVEKSGTAEKPIRFQAAPGENVVITGADEIREWRKEPGGEKVFSAPWPHRFIGWNKTGTHPDDDYHKMIGRCEQVFILGYPLLQVLDRAALSRGTFYVDLDAKRIYVCPRDGADLSKETAARRIVRASVVVAKQGGVRPPARAFASALRRTWPSTARRSSKATTASSRTASSSR